MGRNKNYTFLLTQSQAEYFLEMIEDDIEMTELHEHELALAKGLERRLKELLVRARQDKERMSA